MPSLLYCVIRRHLPRSEDSTLWGLDSCLFLWVCNHVLDVNNIPVFLTFKTKCVLQKSRLNIFKPQKSLRSNTATCLVVNLLVCSWLVRAVMSANICSIQSDGVNAISRGERDWDFTHMKHRWYTHSSIDRFEISKLHILRYVPPTLWLK